MSFREINIQLSYETDWSDIVVDFFEPMYRNAISADMLLGYFTENVFELFPDSFMAFLNNGGKLRMVLSTEIDLKTVEAIQEGYELRKKLERAFIERVEELLQDELQSAKITLLVKGIAAGAIDVKIAVRHEIPGFVHTKDGIFYETSQDIVAFEGSRNITEAGLKGAQFNNTPVYCNWRNDTESERAQGVISRFQRFWDDIEPKTTVFEFPAVYQQILNERFSETPDLNTAHFNLQQIMIKYDNKNILHPMQKRAQICPRPHQNSAVESWKKNQYQGIFKHCTASGKTISSILCIQEWIKENSKSSFLILVPSADLSRQWHQELNKFLGDECDIHLFDSTQSWTRREVRRCTTPNKKPKIALAIIDTAKGSTFFNAIYQGTSKQELMILVDEVHNIGAPSYQIIFDLQAGAKLGLSATPERHRDPIGTQKILEYFGGVVHQYTLKEGIKDGFLSKYRFIPTFVSLSSAERANYLKYTQQMARYQSSDEDDIDFRQIMRARVVKKAESKILKGKEIVEEHYKNNDKWLIFCEDREQLELMQSAIRTIKYPTILPMQYYAGMDSDRAATLRDLEDNGGIVVAIECLDEGVDIPSLDTGLILASSTNPRQYIQRRGRLLRKGDRAICSIYDILVFPNASDISEDDYEYKNMLKSELIRAREFSETAINSEEAQIIIQQQAHKFGISDLTREIDNHGQEEELG